MKKVRITVLLSFVNLLQLMFLGFGGSFVTEIIKENSNELVLFWSSMFSLILTLFIVYIYVTVFSATRSKE